MGLGNRLNANFCMVKQGTKIDYCLSYQHQVPSVMFRVSRAHYWAHASAHHQDSDGHSRNEVCDLRGQLHNWELSIVASAHSMCTGLISHTAHIWTLLVSELLWEHPFLSYLQETHKKNLVASKCNAGNISARRLKTSGFANTTQQKINNWKPWFVNIFCPVKLVSHVPV